MKTLFWNTNKNPITMLDDLSPEKKEKLRQKHKRFYEAKKTKEKTIAEVNQQVNLNL